MKKYAVLVGILAVALFIVGCSEPAQDVGLPDYSTNTKDSSDTGSSSGKTGKVIFGITDAAAEMGSVSSVAVTIKTVQIHSNAEGWITVASTPQTYDLLQLKAQGSIALLANAELPEGTYQQLRLEVSNVLVTDDTGQHTAKLPSNELKLTGIVEVKPGSTSTATFDFIADESLHITGNGEYVLAPVIQLETRTDANVQISGKTLNINEGKILTKTKVGMDASGKVGAGLRIGKEENLEIEGNVVKIKATTIGSVKSEGKSGNTSVESETDVGIGVY